MHALLNSALAHSASRGAESHSTLTTLLPAEGGDLPPRKGAEQQLYLVHVPKTGGASLCAELKAQNQWISSASRCTGGRFDQSQVAEACMRPAREIPNSFVATLFREPREHVMSQYMECAFSYNWTAPSRGEGGVPGSQLGGSFAEKDFTAWLRHFQAWQPGKGDYHCYNPWNMQTRQMICTSANKCFPHHVHGAEACRTAPPTRLTPGHASVWPHARSQSPRCARLLADGEAIEPPVPELEQLDFVGVTELYDESWCLLNWQLDGSLPDMCTCEYMGQDRPGLGEEFTAESGDAWYASSRDGDQSGERTRNWSSHAEKQSATRWHGGEVNETHGAGPHPKADELGKSARELVDLVTASDRALYSRAVARLLKDLCALDLLCPAQLAALKHRTRHLPGAQTAIDEASSWNCKPVLQVQTNASAAPGSWFEGG